MGQSAIAESQCYRATARNPAWHRREQAQRQADRRVLRVAKEVAQYQEMPVAAVLRQCRLNTKFMYGI